MAAGVEEDPGFAVLVGESEDARLADLAHEVGAGRADERSVAQADPAAVEVLELPGEHCGIRKRCRGEHRRAGHRPMSTFRTPSARFLALRQASRPALSRLVQEWLPEGRREGSEWIALNPRRTDQTLGSFKVNLETGLWADFATGDTGGDAISLVSTLGVIIKYRRKILRLYR